ncbi:Intracellular sulfur oxidation protein, DsrE/DsrF family [Parasphingorhabdus marina DSM 22363]|uniref:Intracellular sulfur oxidation protein, DsrE/DsrF family n=1 Tax=Parasphingorhabdus marina DSM 22363 TaxID=1123272 RepID=A0A1N6HTJ8_9SPHN|nr:DsrE family protein [Parasphingorhabdus marina]SIO23066.1 Intracellular sulfur oxidation protein, DsrE/DsrF family [Parasphingorhabdus marina DSM 22363]
MKSFANAFCLSIMVAITPASAQPEGFETGPVFTDFGPAAEVQTDTPLPADSTFRIAFDVAKKADPDKLNRTIESAARFINMHVKAGVPAENIRLAIVVHGGAAGDVVNQAVYGARNEGATNGSAAAIAALQEKGVTFHLCGQSAAAYKIRNADLLPGVRMDLSAMTAHAQLQQQGFTLNPF